MKSAVILLAFVQLTVSSAHSAFAQFRGTSGAGPTATRELTIGAFAGATYVKPDQGRDYAHYVPGFVGGLDVTRRFGRTFVSIDPTLGRSISADTTLNYFLGNVLIGRSIRSGSRIRPFGVIGIGYGVVDYPNKYHDNSVLQNLGLGVSYDLSEHFAVRAHWEYQFWDVGKETNGFNSNGFQADLFYRFGFGLKRGHR